jgi:rubrerythrin
MSSADALKAIETAIQIEREGLAFYSLVAEQVSDPKGKIMFETLARDEQSHLDLFRSVRERLMQGGGWLSPEEVKAIAPERRPPIFPRGEAIGQVEVPERELAALKRGIEAEEASIDFYSEQMAKTGDPAAKEMYAYLIGQEEGHRTILEGEYDYLTGTGFWFDIREFDLEAPG